MRRSNTAVSVYFVLKMTRYILKFESRWLHRCSILCGDLRQLISTNTWTTRVYRCTRQCLGEEQRPGWSPLLLQGRPIMTPTGERQPPPPLATVFLFSWRSNSVVYLCTYIVHSIFVFELTRPPPTTPTSTWSNRTPIVFPAVSLSATPCPSVPKEWLISRLPCNIISTGRSPIRIPGTRPMAPSCSR